MRGDSLDIIQAGASHKAPVPPPFRIIDFLPINQHVRILLLPDSPTDQVIHAAHADPAIASSNLRNHLNDMSTTGTQNGKLKPLMKNHLVSRSPYAKVSFIPFLLIIIEFPCPPTFAILV